MSNAEVPRPTTNVAEKKPVEAFTTHSPALAASALTDGVFGKGAKFWSSRGFAGVPDHRLYPEWVTVDLGRHYLIHTVRLHPRGDAPNAGRGFPEDFTIQGCSEGEPWTKLVERKSHPQPAGSEPADFAFTPRVVRYVKIEATRLRPVNGVLTEHLFQLAEVEVLGAPVEAPPLPVAVVPAAAVAPVAVNLSCEHRVEPLGIDAARPRLGWTMNGNARGQRQTAYQVLVARTRIDLDADRGTLWDSGKVDSSTSVGVIYQGKQLPAGAEIFWKVRLWDKDGAATAWSAPARFVMGRLAPSDWKGQWIGANEDPRHAAVYLRKEFDLARPVRRATVHFSGLGWSHLSVDGRPVNDWVLSPGNTSYHIRAPYLTVDVTRHFEKPGRKALAVVLGDGWYALSKDPWVHKFETLPYVDQPKLLLDLELEFDDGSVQVVHSDASWKWNYGPITRNWIASEDHDLRKVEEGWDKPGFTDAGWRDVALVKGPAGRLVAQREPPTRVIDRIRPQRVTQVRPGTWRYEFGREFQGWVEFSATGPAGTAVAITVFPQKYVNRFTLAGKGVETYRPRFHYNAITAIEVSGVATPPGLEDLVGCQINADLQTTGAFVSSDDTLNWMHGSVIRTFMNYVIAVPNDPTREKKGWTQDIETQLRPASYLFDVRSLFERWHDDLRDGQAKDGNCPNVTPGPFYDSFNSTWWGGTVVWGPWYWYQAYGDRRILLDSYPAMKRYVDFLTTQGKDGMQDWGLADWLAIEDTHRMVNNTPAYYLYAGIVSRVAAMQGLTDDAKKYEELAQSIRRRYNEKFLFTKTGVYNLPDAKPIAGVGGAAGDSNLVHRVWWKEGEPVCTQGAQALALALGLVPDDVRTRAEASLLSEIEAHDGFISSGFVSTGYLLEVLTDLAPEVAQAMVDKRTAPSWYAMTVGSNNDVMRETWSGGAALMPPLGCSLAFWNFHALAGIRPDPNGPGFRTFIIKPNPVGDLHWVRAHYDSTHGRIESHWQRRGQEVAMDVTIPANTSATVFVPADRVESIKEGGKPLAEAAGVRLLRVEGGRTVLACTSGVYRFTSHLPTSKKGQSPSSHP